MVEMVPNYAGRRCFAQNLWVFSTDCMEDKTIKLDIKPFSVNKSYGGRKYRSEDYDNFESELLLILPRMEVPKGVPLRLHLWWGFSTTNADYDNPIKPFQDVLQTAYEFNDRDIFEGKQTKEIVPKGKEYIRFLLEAI